MNRIDRTVLRVCASAAVLVGSLAWPAAGWSRARECPTRDQIAGLFDRWNAKLVESGRQQDPSYVVSTYATDAILLPTCTTSGPLFNRDNGIKEYFKAFIKKHPVGKIDERARNITIDKPGCNIAFDIGLYTFEMDGEKPPERVELQARYTFVYRKIEGKWQIAHQHSSVRRQSDAACLPK